MVLKLNYSFYYVGIFVLGYFYYVQCFLPGLVQTNFELAIKTVQELRKVETIEDIDIHEIPYGKDVLCRSCTVIFDFLIASHNLPVPQEVTKRALVRLCSFIQTESVCRGIIELNMPIFLEILHRKPDLRAKHVCHTVFEDLCATEPIVEWSIDIPDQPQEIPKLYYKGDTKVMQVGHITDTHVDTRYYAGSTARGCREPLCCRDYQGSPESPTDAAGDWGDYRGCDIPLDTVHNLLITLGDGHKDIEYVYMTGDLIAHNIWDTTREENIKQIEKQGQLFREILGENVKIFPVLGNHEPHPSNVLAPPEITEYSPEWLYEAFYNAWCQDFPPDTKSTFLRGGYYTVSPTPGLRIIGLNSLFGYVYNWWMILNPVDPGGQLEWLKTTLLEAEASRERVHILMHGPPTESDTLRVWKREYNRIIHRFQSTIAGQFLGHTHRDQFYVHYAPESTEPTAVAWNGGSVTAFTNVNPNYRVYFIDKHSWEVNDFDTYAYNLTEANQTPNEPPKWYKLYSFKEAFGMSTLRPKDMDSLVKKMTSDDNFFNKYFLFYMKNSDIAFRKGCDSSCRKKHLCKIVSNSHNTTQCRNILQDSYTNLVK